MTFPNARTAPVDEMADSSARCSWVKTDFRVSRFDALFRIASMSPAISTETSFTQVLLYRGAGKLPKNVPNENVWSSRWWETAERMTSSALQTLRVPMNHQQFKLCLKNKKTQEVMGGWIQAGWMVMASQPTNLQEKMDEERWKGVDDKTKSHKTRRGPKADGVSKDDDGAND